MNAHGDDLRATPAIVLATESLRAIQVMAARPDASVEEIQKAAELSLARLSFLGRPRSRGSLRLRWLAKVTSYPFPRTFSVGPLPDTDDHVLLQKAARRQNHVCFTAEITQGAKGTEGREIELQVPADMAGQLGRQLIRIAESFGPTIASAVVHRRRTATPNERRRMT